MNRKLVLWMIVVLVIGGALWVFLQNRKPTPVKVEAARVFSGPLYASFTADGVVKTMSADLSAETQGRITSLTVHEGKRVSKGDVLAEFDDEEVHAQERQASAAVNAASEAVRQSRVATQLAIDRANTAERTARANLKAAQARLEQVKKGARKEEIAQAEHRLAEINAQLDEADKALTRARELYREGAIPKADLDRAEARAKSIRESYEAAADSLALLKAGATKEEIDMATAQLESARSEVEAAKNLQKEVSLRRSDTQMSESRLREANAALEAVRAMKAKSQLLAPFGGVITKKLAELGQMATPGVTLMTLQSENSLYIEAEVSSEDSSKIVDGMIVQVSQPGLPGRTFDGKVTLIAPAAEIKPDSAVRTRILRVRVTLISGSELFRPGMEVDVEGRREIEKKTLLMPADALVLETGVSSVYKVVDGNAVLTEIKAGYMSEGRIEVLNGLAEGDLVVVGGKEKLTDGAPVMIREK